jgi:hypothetical protein
MTVSAVQRKVLLGDGVSRCNKMHLCSGWGIEWRWEGEGTTPNGTMRSRMLFLIDGTWQRGKSWDEDVRPTLNEATGG